jgi:CheY-like chemotaxis protein
MAMSVLVVDDSAVSRKIVIRSLPPEWDVAITQASNGSEALAALGEKHHAVVLLDLNMPVMDGYEFLEAMTAAITAVPGARPIVTPPSAITGLRTPAGRGGSRSPRPAS